LHVTLKFIGEKADSAVEGIKQALETVGSCAIEMRLRDYGFFPSAKAPRVFWIGIEAGPQLAALAAAVDTRMAALGVPKEEHAFSPHLTLARAAGGSGSPHGRKRNVPTGAFQRLQEKLAALPAPEFGAMTAHAFHLYRSQLSPGGSKYSKLAGFDLL
jgi:2'-5' RNA ligase